MPAIALPVATFLAGSVLTLVLPLVILIAVVIWYVRVWSGDMGQS